MLVQKRNGSFEELNINKLHKAVEWACEGLDVSQSEIEVGAHIQLFDGISSKQIQDALMMSAADLISKEEPDYQFAAARILLQSIYKEVTGGPVDYPPLRKYMEEMVKEERLDKEVLELDLEFLDTQIKPERDLKFRFLGLKTLYDRYFIRGDDGRTRELPQHFFMRVAIGLTLKNAEKKEEREKWAVEFYNIYSNHKFLSSTPTLFNSATMHPQLSSCFLMTMGDDTDKIFRVLKECGLNSKFSGGLGLDITPPRARGSFIKSTKGKAGGIMPYGKLFNDVLIGWDQSGKRAGSGALYLEVWHADIEMFLDAKNKIGEDRYLFNDASTATWLPDLFMERVREDKEWSLFSPSDVPMLHEVYGETFREMYLTAEKLGLATKVIRAKDLWRTIMQKLYQTGYYWPCFKDTINERHMQKDSGIVHSSNLCTEITLRTDDETSAVCNLGSINLVEHDSFEDIMHTVKIAMRMLDNVITVGWLPDEKGRKFNYEERAVGLGVMGYTADLVKRGIAYESQEHLDYADELFEHISYAAISASCDLADERGAYPLFAESEWAKGILPIHTANEKASELVAHRSLTLGDRWFHLAERVKKGVRNSHMLALAPTATIANILGTSAVTELPKEDQYEKENLSGTFTIFNPGYLFDNGRGLVVNALDVDQIFTVKATAVRQRWIDQSQSTNIWVRQGIKGSELANIYMTGWKLGVKTFYYLKGQSSEIEQVKKKEVVEEQTEAVDGEDLGPSFCSITDDGCLSCQ